MYKYTHVICAYCGLRTFHLKLSRTWIKVENFFNIQVRIYYAYVSYLLSGFICLHYFNFHFHFFFIYKGLEACLFFIAYLSLISVVCRICVTITWLKCRCGPWAQFVSIYSRICFARQNAMNYICMKVISISSALSIEQRECCIVFTWFFLFFNSVLFYYVT